MATRRYDRMGIVEWLRGKGMPQFSDRDFFGHQVCLRPEDWLRKHIIPVLNMTIVPYFYGSDIYFILHIKPNEGKTTETLKYTWYLFKKDCKEPCNSGTGVAVVSNKEYKAKLFLGHLSYTYEYKVDIEVSMNNETHKETMADFETTSRAVVESKVIWFFAGVLVAFLINLLAKCF